MVFVVRQVLLVTKNFQRLSWGKAMPKLRSRVSKNELSLALLYPRAEQVSLRYIPQWPLICWSSMSTAAANTAGC